MRATSRPLTIALSVLTVLVTAPLGHALAPAAAVSGASFDANANGADDPGRIAALAQQVATGDWQAQRDAIATLAKNHGAFAVNGLLRWIGSQADLEERVHAVFALRRLGDRAELAVLAGLHSSDPMVRRSLCMVLAAVGDRRAVPTLAALVARDPDPLTREQAALALDSLGGADGGDAANLLASLSGRYRAGDAIAVRASEDRTQLFFWNGKGVAHRVVSEALYPMAYALLFAQEGLRFDVNSLAAQQQIVAAYQGMRAVIGREAGEEGGEGGDKSWIASLPAISDLLALGGVAGPVVMARPTGSAVEPMAGAGDLIHSDDKRLRYKAALSLVAGDPSPDVVAVLADALSESAVRQVLVVDNDRGELNALVAVVGDRETYAVGATSGAQGLVRAKATPVKDAVILRSTLRDIPVDRMVGNLARDVRTRDVPVIVVADEGEMGRLRTLLGDRVVGVVPAPIDRAVLQPSLDAAFEKAKLNDQRMAAEQFSQKAAAALARTSRAALAPAVPALIHAIGRDDKIQIPALRALARIGPAPAQEPARALFADGSASTAARVAAAGALAGILARNDGTPGTFKTLRAALNGKDSALKTAAARALGAARSLSVADRSKLLLEQAIQF